MQSCMLVGGGINFKEPHMNKEKRRQAGEDIEVFTCSEEAYKTAYAKLNEF